MDVHVEILLVRRLVIAHFFLGADAAFAHVDGFQRVQDALTRLANSLAEFIAARLFEHLQSFSVFFC